MPLLISTVVIFQAQKREAINSTWKVALSFKIIMTTSVTRPCFSTQPARPKLQDWFLVSDRSCLKTGGLRLHHWSRERPLLCWQQCAVALAALPLTQQRTAHANAVYSEVKHCNIDSKIQPAHLCVCDIDLDLSVRKWECHLTRARKYVSIEVEVFMTSRSSRHCIHGVRMLISRRRTSLFGHIARFDATVPGHQALWLQTNISTGRRKPGTSWKRLPGRPSKTWASQIPDDTGMSSRSLTGTPPFVVAMEEGRYGLWRLRVDDDDDDSGIWARSRRRGRKRTERRTEGTTS